MLSMNPDLKEKIVKFTREYDGESDEIFKSHKFLTNLERSVGAKNKEALQALLKRDPRRMIILQETLARDFTNQLPKLTSDYIANHPLTDDDGNKLTNAEITKLENDFKSKELQRFGISEKLAAKIVVGEVNRQTETNKGIRTAKINNDFHTQLRASAKSIFRTASGSVDTKALPESIRKEIVLRSSNFKKLDDGTTALQQATEEVVNDLIELADNGYIPMGALAGLADYKFEHSAGKDGEASVIDAFFAKDGRHFNRLIRGVERGQIKFIAAQTGIDQAALEEIKTRRSQGIINAEDNDLLDKISHRGLVSDESIEGVREVKPQDSNFFVNESKYFETTKIDGTFLTKSNIARAKLNDSNIAKEQEAVLISQKANQFPNFETRRKVNDNIISQDSKKRTLGDGEVLGENTFKGQLSAEMTRLEDILYMKYYKLNPDDTDITTRVAADMARIKQEKGFGIAVGETGSGVWSKDSNGDYPNFVRTKIGEIDIKDNRTSWSGSVVDAWGQTKDLNIPGETRTEKLLNIPNSILTPDKILDNLQNGITPELLYKTTMIPGKNETEVLQAIGEALLNNPDQKDFVQKNNIKKLLENIPTTQISLKELVEKSNDADLKAIDRNLANASPKQLKRYHDKLLIMEDQGKEDAQQALQKIQEDTEQKAKQRKKELERKKADIIRKKQRDEKRDEFIDSSADLSSAIQQGTNLINNISPSTDYIQ